MHHAYDNPDFGTNFAPLRTGDTVRLFHGFRDPEDAVALARIGMSGRMRANRVYSYEADNNPTGLFTTLSRKVAAEFVGAYRLQVIAEFSAAVEDLEAPVWPGGGYTVQGGYSQYFGHGREGKAARRQRIIAAEQEAVAASRERPDDLRHVTESDFKLLASTLCAGREYQALFLGDLNPDDVAAYHVRPAGALITDPWERKTPQEFANLTEQMDLKPEARNHSRVFQPRDDFNGAAFLTRMQERYSFNVEEGLKHMWRHVYGDKPGGTRSRKSHGAAAAFVQHFETFLWPKQMAGAMTWMHRKWSEKPELTESVTPLREHPEPRP